MALLILLVVTIRDRIIAWLVGIVAIFILFLLKNKPFQVSLGIPGFVCIFCYAITVGQLKKEKIDLYLSKGRNITCGVITSIGLRSGEIRVKYKAFDETYSISSGVPNSIVEHCVGDTVLIVYSLEKPEYSRVRKFKPNADEINEYKQNMITVDEQYLSEQEFSKPSDYEENKRRGDRATIIMLVILGVVYFLCLDKARLWSNCRSMFNKKNKKTKNNVQRNKKKRKK